MNEVQVHQVSVLTLSPKGNHSNLSFARRGWRRLLVIWIIRVRSKVTDVIAEKQIHKSLEPSTVQQHSTRWSIIISIS